MHRSVAILSLSALFAACGSSSEDASNKAGRGVAIEPEPASRGVVEKGAARFEGTLEADRPFSLQHVFFTEGSFTETQPGLFVAISDDPAMCEHLKQLTVAPEHTYVGVGIARNDGEALASGEFDSENEAVLVAPMYYRFGPECEEEGPGNWQMLAAGTVVIDQLVSGEFLSGTVRVKNEAGQDASGSFRATYCPATAVLENLGIAGAKCAD